MSVTRMFGASVKRREDPRLITGDGMFTDDFKLPGMLQMTVLRSPYAHARIVRIDTTKARALPGVRAVYTAKDLEGMVGPMPCAWLIPEADLKVPVYTALASDKTRFVGDGVAVVVADDSYIADDALDLIEVEYEELPAVTNQEEALKPGAPLLYDSSPGNQAFHWKFRNGDADGALQRAEVRIKQRFIQQRLVPNAMEPRASIADWNAGAGELTLYNTTQNPHIVRFQVAVTQNIPEHKIRVIARDVGGGFGSKIPYYPGDALAIFASRMLKHPVRWTEDRRENFVATIHGRDQ
ncbi:MAG TPA: molybdopterin cofactor-binding domain-containing protein, partial [Ktedonobacterales bacterium]